MDSTDKKGIISYWKKRYLLTFAFSLEENFFSSTSEKVFQYSE